MKTKSRADDCADIKAGLSALVLSFVVLALSACASASTPSSDPVRASQTVQTQPQPHAYTQAQAARRASSRDMFAVSYRADGIVITSSSPPTVETLPSGMFRVTFTHP